MGGYFMENTKFLKGKKEMLMFSVMVSCTTHFCCCEGDTSFLRNCVYGLVLYNIFYLYS